ncbi:MAG: 6-bladed beta-propeller [Bacteroidales bacterium]
MIVKQAILFFLIFFISFHLFAQEVNTPYIKWVKNFPPAKPVKKQKNMAQKLAELVTGKKEEIKMIKPVAILASNPDTFLVLDQGTGSLLQVADKTLSIPQGLRKQFHDFNSLIGMCVIDNHEILFTDSGLNKVFKINEEKKNITEWNDTLKFKQPTGIAYCKPKKQIWVVETTGHRIIILDIKGNPIKTVGSRGTGPSEFNFPTSICSDFQGNIYVVDAMNFRIQVFNAEGEFLNSFGEAGDASGYFARPKGIATDSSGNVYVVDGLFHGIQVFDSAGNLLYRFGQQGHENEEFWMPNGIYIDNNNFIYVADTYNSRVQVFQFMNTN